MTDIQFEDVTPSDEIVFEDITFEDVTEEKTEPAPFGKRLKQSFQVGVGDHLHGEKELQRRTRGGPKEVGGGLQDLRERARAFARRNESAEEATKRREAQVAEIGNMYEGLATKVAEGAPLDEDAGLLSKGAHLLGEGAVALAGSAPGMALSAVPGGGNAWFFSQFYGAKDKELLGKGVTDDETRHEASLIRGALGMLTEQAGNAVQFRAAGKVLGKVFSKSRAPEKLQKFVGEAAKRIGEGMVGEGMEEYADAYADLAADVYAHNPDVSIGQLVSEFATVATSGEFQAQAIEGAKVGAAAGAILPGAATVVSGFDYRTWKRDNADTDTKVETDTEATPEATPTTSPDDLDAIFKTEEDPDAFASGGTSEDIVRTREAEQQSALEQAAQERLAQLTQAEQAATEAAETAAAEKQQVQAEQAQVEDRVLKEQHRIQSLISSMDPDYVTDENGNKQEIEGTGPKNTLSVVGRALHILKESKDKTSAAFVKVVDKVHDALLLDPSHDNYQALEKLQVGLQKYGFHTQDKAEQVMIGKLDMVLTDRITAAKKAYEADVDKGKREAGNQGIRKKDMILPSQTDGQSIGRALWNYGKNLQAQEKAQQEQAHEPYSNQNEPFPRKAKGTEGPVQATEAAEKEAVGKSPKRKADAAVARFEQRGQEKPVDMGIPKDPYVRSGQAEAAKLEAGEKQQEALKNSTGKVPETVTAEGIQKDRVKGGSVRERLQKVRDQRKLDTEKERHESLKSDLRGRENRDKVEAAESAVEAGGIVERMKAESKKLDEALTKAEKNTWTERVLDRGSVIQGETVLGTRKGMGFTRHSDAVRAAEKLVPLNTMEKLEVVEKGTGYYLKVKEAPKPTGKLKKKLSNVRHKLLDKKYSNQESAKRAIRKFADPLTHRPIETKDGKWIIEEKHPEEQGKVRYAKRTKPAPKKTVKAYKLFRVSKEQLGKIFPLFVKADTPVEVGTWYDADDVFSFVAENGRVYTPAKTGGSHKIPNDEVKRELLKRGHIKSMKTNSIKAVAYRPGWHSGDLPMSKHLGSKSSAKAKAPDTRSDDQVWAEVEMAADVDWQTEANKRADRKKNGEIIARTAHITDQMPADGFYRYKTNPNMVGEWLIGGAMKVVRILSDAEVATLNKEAGVEDLPRNRPLDLKEWGFDGKRYAKSVGDRVRSFGKDPQSVIDTLETLQGASKNASKMKLVKTADQLPDKLKPAESSDTVYAAYDADADTIYMVTDNISDPKQATRLWLHEQVGHGGLAKLFDLLGEDLNKFLDDAHGAVKRSKKLYDQIKKDYATELKELSPEGQKRLIVEEALAYRAENLHPFHRRGLFQKFLDVLNNWLQSITGVRNTLKMKDLDTVLEVAKNYVVSGELAQTSMSTQYGKAKRLALSKGWNKIRDFKVALQEQAKQQFEITGLDLNDRSDKATEHLVRSLVGDAVYALEQNPNAVGWYDIKTRQALAVMTQIHPEIGTDPDARYAFTAAMAITSNGMRVDKNFELAEKAYQYYLKHGKMPTNIKAGQTQGAINSTFKLFNTLVDKWGIENLRKFSFTEFTVKEIGGISQALKPSGEFVDTKVRGASIYGPKIGNGFLSNLNGFFDQLTMDRWLIRTWARLTGTLLDDNTKHIQVQRDRLRKAVKDALENTARDDQIHLTYYLGINIAEDLDLTNDADIDELAAKITKYSIKPDNRKDINQRELGEEVRKAGNALTEYLDAQRKAPTGPAERDYIRGVFTQVLADLNKRKEYRDLSMADLQAALWYAEKLLYDSAKVKDIDSDGVNAYDDSEAPDYANAAVKVAKSMGIPDKQIQQALTKEEQRGLRTGSGRTATARQGNGKAGLQPTGGEQEDPRGFTRRQKKLFQGAVAVKDARSRRVDDAAQSWSFQRRSAGNDRGFRVLKKLGVTWVAQWKPGPKLGNRLRNSGTPTPTYYELQATTENAERFAEAITASKERQGAAGASVYVYPVEEYKDMRLFLAEDGEAGVAVKPDGDIVSVFSSNKSGRCAVEIAIAAGGTKADAFDTILPHLYGAHGLKVVARIPFDPDEAPADWDYDAMKKFNGGRPDVVFMVVDPEYDGWYRVGQGEHLTDYGEALDVQSKAADKPGSKVRYKKAAGVDPETNLALRRSKGMGEHISDFASNLGSMVRNEMGKLTDYWIDSMNPVRQLERELGTSATMSGYRSFRLASNLGAIMGSMFSDGHLTYDKATHSVSLGERDGGLLQVFEGMSEEDMQAIKERLVAERVEELLESTTLDQKIKDEIYGKDSEDNVIDPVAHTAFLKDRTDVWVAANQAKYKEIKKHLDKYNKSVLDLAVQSGIISKEKAGEWAQYATYVPLNRLFPDDGDINGAPMFSNKGDVKGPKAFKGSKGYNIGDPLDNLLTNYSYLVNESLKNIALKKVYHAGTQAGVMVKRKISRAQFMERKKHGQFIAIRSEGKEQYIEVADARLFKALAQLDEPAMTIKALNWAKKALTWGVTISPAFRIRNLIRDTTQTAVLMGEVNVKDVARAFADVMKNHEDLAELRSFGGAFVGDYYAADNPDSIKRLIDQKTGKPKGRLAKMVNVWEKIGEASENANRLALYRKYQKKEGATKAEAAFESKDLLDFGSHGSGKYARFFISIVPFLNARLQGLAKLKRETKRDGDWNTKFIMRSAALAAASLGLHALNRMYNDDEYEDLPENDRNMYWHVWAFGNHLAIPKPFELGAILGELPTRIADAVIKNGLKLDGDGYRRLWKFMGTTARDTFSINPLGQASIVWEQWANKDAFKDRPIVPTHMEKLDPEMQWDHRTSRTARAVGEFMGLSPKRIEHVVEKAFGFAGQASLGVIDHVLMPFVRSYPEDPAMTVDSFYWLHGRIPRGKTRYIRQEQEFYDLFAEVDRAVASYNSLKKLKERPAARAYKREHRAEIKGQRIASIYKDKLSAIRAKEKLIHMNRKLTPEQKREKLDHLIDKRHRIVKRAVERIKSRMERQ